MSRVNKVVIVTGTESKVQKHQKDMCDIKKIVARARRQGFIDPMLVSRREQIFNDAVAQSNDIYEMWQQVEKVKLAFSSVPAFVREKFHNNPLELLAFLQDPKNIEKAIEYGLKEKQIDEEKPNEEKPNEEKK